MGRLICISLMMISFLVSSCYKMESGEYLYTPTFSLPVGTVSTSFADVVSQVELYPVPNNEYDTLPVLWYEDTLYYTPLIFDSVYSKLFNFQELSDQLEDATEIVFRMNFTNQFPTEVFVQVYFVDGNGVITEQLIESSLHEVPAAEIDYEGYVNQASESRVEIPFPRERIDNLTNVQLIRVYTFMHLVPVNGGIYRFYPEQFFSMQLAIRVSIEKEFSSN